MSRIVGVHRSAEHTFSKQPQAEISLVVGHGVEGDAHAGATVKHRSRDQALPNLRQVHLMPRELLDELEVEPGSLGENVTTSGLDLFGLSTGTLLHLGAEVVVEVTGLRNPCNQINTFRPGLLKQVLGLDTDGTVIRRAGIMSVVVTGGIVRPGDAVTVVAPARHVPLECV